jgi:hypothetical protein
MGVTDMAAVMILMARCTLQADGFRRRQCT